MGNIKFTITPEELLNRQGIKYQKKGNWYSCKICPFCEGGKQGQRYTFGIRTDDHNYNCLRSTCSASGNFWMLLKHFNYNPADFIDKDNSEFKKSPKKKSHFVYRRK